MVCVDKIAFTFFNSGDVLILPKKERTDVYDLSVPLHMIIDGMIKS